MRRVILSPTLFALLAAAISAARFAQDPVGHISGTVDAGMGRPQIGATVTLSSNGRVSRTTTTNASGRFEFRDVAIGLYFITARFGGLTRQVPVEVGAHVTWTVTVSLGGQQEEKANVRPPAALPPPSVIAGMERTGVLTGNDRHGHRAEFVRLVDAAKALTALHAAK
jgi:hypothetical protein